VDEAKGMSIIAGRATKVLEQWQSPAEVVKKEEICSEIAGKMRITSSVEGQTSGTQVFFSVLRG